MDIVLDYLMQALNLIWQFPADHPMVSLVLGALAGRGGPVVYHVFWLVNAFRDRYFDDTEAAAASWRLAALIYGVWPTKSADALLKYAPKHWHPVILEGMAPEFRLVAVPLDRVADVHFLLQQHKK